MQNPYSSPTSERHDTTGKKSGPSDELLGSRALIARWERLRVPYNAIAILFVVILTLSFHPANLKDPIFWTTTVLVGAVANLCFLLGPALETYGRHFGFWAPWMAWTLFVAGTTLTLVLTAEWIAHYRELTPYYGSWITM